MMHMLDQFDDVNVVHQINNQGWEPLDAHTSGDLSVKSLTRLLDMIYGCKDISMSQINRLYTKTSKLPLCTFSNKHSVGLKMRLVPHQYVHPWTRTGWPSWNAFWDERLQRDYSVRFRAALLSRLAMHGVTAFITVRQDLLRWALSKYHGDGTGSPGHLQFKLANGEIRHEQISKLHVDCEKLEEVIARCRSVHEENRRLRDTLKGIGVSVFPLRYELFLEDKHAFFRQISNWLVLDWSETAIYNVINSETYLKKVHSNDISDFVENAEEVLDRFEPCWEGWSDDD